MSGAPTLLEACREWFRIGVLSFGGPTAQIALMHKVVVEERGWLTEKQFLGALSFCMLLPGPEAMQLATYAGWRLHGVIGGLIAGLLFVIPGALVVLLLAMLYAGFGEVPLVDAAFLGIKAAVVIIVVEALIRIFKRALTHWHAWATAGASFIAIAGFSVPFPMIILVAAIAGAILSKPEPTDTETAKVTVRPAATVSTIALWLTIWWGPIAAMVLLFGSDHILTDIGLFFSKLAVVTFGGAYAVLAYMVQDVVAVQGWLETGQMMAGLGLAETTPGPLILVTEFVGYFAAWSQGGLPLGIAGAGVALWVTFAPCFLWIFAGAPYIEWISAQQRLRGALSFITAAVVGVILNLSIWFALHVSFARVERIDAGPVGFWVPDWGSVNLTVLGLTMLSGILILRLHWSIQRVLAVVSVAAVALAMLPI